MKCYFGFALASGMFTGDCTIKRSLLTVEQVRAAIARGVISCCNSSHEATVKALQERFGLMVELPEKPPQVTLNVGEKLIVMGVRGLPRLTDRHHYTDEEIAKATFEFVEYVVE